MADNDLQIILPESDDFLSCPKCKTANPLESNFCLNCGTRLLTSARSSSRWLWIVMLFIGLVGVGYYFQNRLSEPEPYNPPAKIPPLTTTAPAETRQNSTEKETPPPKNEVIPLSTPSKFKIPAGMVVIKDISGKVLNEVMVPVVGGGWIALPKRVCLGGSEWFLKMGPDLEVSIVGGIYKDYDRIGLWRIMEDIRIDGPELYPWSADAPLTWLALTSLDSPEPVKFGNPNEQGYFIEGRLAEDFYENGILVQQGRVVGWTFGQTAEGAFVWNGDEGKFLHPEIRVDDFYRITFANSREEEFVRALAMGTDYSGLERLEALAGAFRFDPKLAVKDTPEHLQAGTVISGMKTLIENALKAGLGREVARIFDAQILVEAADADLVSIVTRATAQSFGFEEALELAENVIDGLPAISEQDGGLLTQLFAELYQNWLTALINQGNLQGAWRTYRLASSKLPEDLNIHLMGVQLALADNNWVEAEEILAMKEYPPSLKDKVQNLQNQIAELKAQEGKIIINFTPGTQHIPASATLNHRLEQKFIVDTGASMVTIPLSAANRLGLTIDDSKPMRKIFTAGGVTYAPEVNLTSVTIDGWEVNNVAALILDLPNQPGWGLLGLNYLHRFRLDINSEMGVMLLEPR